MGAANTETPPPAERDQRLRRWVVLAQAAGVLLVGSAIVAAVPWLRHSALLCIHGDFNGLRDYIRGPGAGGVALLLALMLTHAVIYYPTEIVTATAGFVYGWLGGLALALGGWLLSALLSYLLGRLLAGRLLRSLLGARYAGFERAIRRGGTPLLISGRLIPVVPFSFMGYAAGAVRIGVWRFAWTTVVGFLPLTVAVTYLGSRAQQLSLTSPLVWIAVAILVGLVVAARSASPR